MSVIPQDIPAAPAGRTVIRIARTSVVLLFLAWVIDYIDRLVITLALPSIGHQFGLDKTEQGLVLTAFFLTYAAFQVPGGMLADRFGSKATMLVALVAWSVFTGLTGIAMNFAVLLVIRALFGITEGVFPPASMKAISERTLPEDRMTANGAMLASNPLGSAIAPLVAAPAMLAVGWRAAFFIVAGAGVLMAVVLAVGLPKPLPAATTQAAGDAAAARRVRPGELIRCRTLWHFALLFCGFDIVSWGLISWAPSYLLDERGISLSKVGVLSSIPWFVAAGVTVVGGIAFDRFFHDRARRLIVPSMLVTAVFLGFMIRARSADGFVLYESLGMAAMWVSFMPIFGLPLRLLPAPVAGIGGALVNFGGQLAGAITPFIMGWLADAYSFAAAFSFLLVGCALAVLAAATVPQTAEAFRRRLPSNVRDLDGPTVAARD
ncbi:MAG: transporter [Actinoallomurus sp.]|nr:transporter [Actinoallomurus sp.]